MALQVRSSAHRRLKQRWRGIQSGGLKSPESLSRESQNTSRNFRTLGTDQGHWECLFEKNGGSSEGTHGDLRQFRRGGPVTSPQQLSSYRRGSRTGHHQAWLPLLGLTSQGVTREDLLPARVAVITSESGDTQTRKDDAYTRGKTVVKNCLP